jgi:hypothetical protein
MVSISPTFIFLLQEALLVLPALLMAFLIPAVSVMLYQQLISIFYDTSY